MTLSEEKFLEKLKEFHKEISEKSYDNISLTLLFTKFLVDNYDEYTANNDVLLDKMSLVCEEYEIDLDECIMLVKTL